MKPRGELLFFLLPLISLACSDRPTGVASRGPSVQAAVTSQSVGTTGVLFRTDSASVNGVGCWVDGTVNGCVQASRSRLGPGSGTTFLFYQVQQCVPDGPPPPDTIPGDSLPPPPVICTTLEGGFGTIPSGDLTGSGIGGLRLETNTSAAANPGFTRFAGSGGLVSVDWARSGAFSSRFTGTGEFRFGDFVQQFNGTSWFSDARVSGSVVAFSIVNPTFANIFRSRAHVIVRGP